MTTMTKSRTVRKPQPVHGVACWLGSVPTRERLDDGDAILKIAAAGKEAAFYHVETLKDGAAVTGYRLVKIDGFDQTATYDVEITPYGFRCDCPDATYTDRPGGCKHGAGLRAALKAANLL